MSPPPPPLGKGCCTWYYPGCLWNARVSVMSGFCRSYLPHCTWPRLVLRFICILCAPAWQMVGEEAGCLLGAAARDQAGSQGPQRRMPTHWAPQAQPRLGPIQILGYLLTLTASEGCKDLTFAFSKDLRGPKFQKGNVEVIGRGGRSHLWESLIRVLFFLIVLKVCRDQR